MAVIFRELAREWWERNMLEDGNPEYADESWRRLEKHLLPFIGEREVKRLTAPQFLKPIRRVEARGTPWVARKIKSHASQIMQYGISLRRNIEKSGARFGRGVETREKHFARRHYRPPANRRSDARH